MTEVLLLSAIRTDGGTQPRASIDAATVEDYAADMQRGEVFPPVVVFHDGEHYWLADGFHRVLAARASKWTDIPTDIRQGTRRDAVLFSVGANAQHGLRRTNADKRRAVETLLRDEEWRGWSDNAIAKQCGVTHPTVSKIRVELYPTDLKNLQVKGSPTGNGFQSNPLRRGTDGRTINTANIGKGGKPAAPSPPPAAVQKPPFAVGDAVITRTNRSGTITSINGDLFMVETDIGTSPHHADTLRRATPASANTLPPAGGKGAEIRDRLNAQGIVATRVVAHKDGTFTAGFAPNHDPKTDREIALLRATAMQGAGWDVIEHLDGCVADNDQTGRPLVKFRERTADAPGITDRQRDILRGIHFNVGKRPDGFLRESFIDRRDLYIVAQMPQGLLEAKREGGRAMPIILYRLTPIAYDILGITPPADPDATKSPDDYPPVEEEDEDEEGRAEIRGVVTSFPATDEPGKPRTVASILTSCESDEWYTPQWVIDAERAVMGDIDFDPASCELANQTVEAGAYLTIDDDGLSQPWHGRCHVNPPYGTNKSGWIRKLIREYEDGAVEEAFLIVTASTGNAWFQELWTYPICFFSRRIGFDKSDGTGTGNIGSSVAVYFGPNPDRFIEVFSRYGVIVVDPIRARSAEEESDALAAV